MSVKREAIKDADEFAMAKMFYGEGAGVRRKLINETVNFKIVNVPGYRELFQRELARQDFAKLSRKARRERKLKDSAAFIGKNGRALARGDRRGISLPVASAFVLALLAHQQGYDKKAWNYTKQKYRDSKAYIETKWFDHRAQNRN